MLRVSRIAREAAAVRRAPPARRRTGGRPRSRRRRRCRSGSEARPIPPLRHRRRRRDRGRPPVRRRAGGARRTARARRDPAARACGVSAGSGGPSSSSRSSSNRRSAAVTSSASVVYTPLPRRAVAGSQEAARRAWRLASAQGTIPSQPGVAPKAGGAGLRGLGGLGRSVELLPLVVEQEVGRAALVDAMLRVSRIAREAAAREGRPSLDTPFSLGSVAKPQGGRRVLQRTTPASLSARRRPP
jgi:hypothetical protein